MNNKPLKHQRNLFEVENARNLSMHELVDTFIPTEAFWRLLSPKHHVVLGARGQGKTALAKMLSHHHLALMAKIRPEKRVTSAIYNQDFIGIYLPTRLEWVGGLKNKAWMNENEKEELFQWRLNIASCIAFIPVAKSCISTYIDEISIQAEVERKLAHLLSKDWFPDLDLIFDNLLQLRRHLEDTDYRKSIQILRNRSSGCLNVDELDIGISFGIDLLLPLRQGIRQLSRLLSINPDCTWFLCIDEAEFLDEMHHRIINSHMRAYPENLFIKLTTTPYCHYTLETNVGANLANGEDFQYINMDLDSVMNARATGEKDTIGTMFGRTLFAKLLEVSYQQQFLRVNSRDPSNADEILGKSEILDPVQKDWSLGSENMKLLEKYASSKTIARAHRLIGTNNFSDQVSRKIHGALLLHKEIAELKGNKNSSAYSGAKMAIRCADGNPRHLIKIFNALLMKLTKQQKKTLAFRKNPGLIPPKEQTRAMKALSTTTLNQVRSFPDVGPKLHEFLNAIGEYMRMNLHLRLLTTDQIVSIKIGDTISDEDWKLVQVAVAHGLLHPNIGSGDTDEMPWRTGTFHLSYALAPHFNLLPRQGKSVELSLIKQFQVMSKNRRKVYMEHKCEQFSLLKNGEQL